MINAICRFVNFAVVIVDTPVSIGADLPGITNIVAIAMLIAERDQHDVWNFSLRSHAVGAGDGEDALFEWAVGAMPEDGIVVGWQFADGIVAPLLEASRDADPDIATAFLKRLLALVNVSSVDLSIHHGGAGAPAFASIAGTRGIALPMMTPDEIMTAWSFGDVACLADHACAQAVATWELWLAEANGTAPSASRAFDAWRSR